MDQLRNSKDLKIYDYSDKKEDEQKLPELEKNKQLSQNILEIKQNFTKPPNRYSEAGLIKKLEELELAAHQLMFQYSQNLKKEIM